MKIIYFAGPRAGFNDETATVYGMRIEGIRQNLKEKTGTTEGLVAAVVEAGMDPSDPLFSWRWERDKDRAAQRFWESQCHDLMRVILVERPDGTRQRAFESIPVHVVSEEHPEEEPKRIIVWATCEEIETDSEFLRASARQCVAELRGFARKYDRLKMVKPGIRELIHQIEMEYDIQTTEKSNEQVAAG